MGNLKDSKMYIPEAEELTRENLYEVADDRQLLELGKAIYESDSLQGCIEVVCKFYENGKFNTLSGMVALATLMNMGSHKLRDIVAKEVGEEEDPTHSGNKTVH